MPWQTARKDPAYGRAPWRRARLACLRAASWRCEIRLEGCQGAASQVDHVLGLASDPEHRVLRAACGNCHRKVTAQQGGGYRSAAKGEPAVETRTAW